MKVRSGAIELLILLAAYTCLFIFFEKIYPAWNALRCLWPVQNSTNVLLVADPQLIDNHTYPGRNEQFLRLSQHTVDVYLRKNYKPVVGHLRPDYIFFLGDYLDNGRLTEDGYWFGEVARFHRIFDVPGYTHHRNWFTNVAGNHDIGLADGVKPHSSERFAEHFGRKNHLQTISGVDFVQLDTPSYAASEWGIAQELHDFVDSLGEPKNPRIVLTHVPFYRDTDKHSCGPLREKARFDQNWGYQYQLALSPLISEELLQKLRPQLLFTADNHDYCDIVHEATGTREITVKAVSLAMGILRPAVQLLSFNNTSGFSYDTQLCPLTRPYLGIFVYVVFSVFTAILLFVHHFQKAPSRYSYSLLPSYEDHSERSMRLKVVNFVKEQDGDVAHVLPLPTYTRTGENQAVLRAKKSAFYVLRLLRRWNLISFVKNSGMLFVLVVLLYRVVLWTV